MTILVPRKTDKDPYVYGIILKPCGFDLKDEQVLSDEDYTKVNEFMNKLIKDRDALNVWEIVSSQVELSIGTCVLQFYLRKPSMTW